MNRVLLSVVAVLALHVAVSDACAGGNLNTPLFGLPIFGGDKNATAANSETTEEVEETKTRRAHARAGVTLHDQELSDRDEDLETELKERLAAVERRIKEREERKLKEEEEVEKKEDAEKERRAKKVDVDGADSNEDVIETKTRRVHSRRESS